MKALASSVLLLVLSLSACGADRVEVSAPPAAGRTFTAPTGSPLAEARWQVVDDRGAIEFTALDSADQVVARAVQRVQRTGDEVLIEIESTAPEASAQRTWFDVESGAILRTEYVNEPAARLVLDALSASVRAGASSAKGLERVSCWGLRIAMLSCIPCAGGGLPACIGCAAATVSCIHEGCAGCGSTHDPAGT